VGLRIPERKAVSGVRLMPVTDWNWLFNAPRIEANGYWLRSDSSDIAANIQINDPNASLNDINSRLPDVAVGCNDWLWRG